MVIKSKPCHFASKELPQQKPEDPKRSLAK